MSSVLKGFNKLLLDLGKRRMRKINRFVKRIRERLNVVTFQFLSKQNPSSEMFTLHSREIRGDK